MWPHPFGASPNPPARRSAGLGPLLVALALLFGGALAPRPAAAQTGGITGFVVDSIGRAIPFASVLVESGPRRAQTITAPNGSYLLSNLPIGTYTLVARRTGFTEDRRTVTVLAGTTSRVDFTLQPLLSVGGTLQGTVTHTTTGRPIPGAQVTAVSLRTTVTATTDSAGFYRFTGLPPDSYQVTVSRAGFQSATRFGVLVRQGGTTIQNFRLALDNAALSRLFGRITDPVGRGVAGATITLLNGFSGGATARSRSDGSFSLSGIVPDTYTVTVTAAGFQPFVLSDVTLGPAAAVELNPQLAPLGRATAVLQGFVFDSLGRPIRGAHVETTTGPDVERFAVTDATGFYQIGALPPGAYTVTAFATGFVPETLAVTLVEDTTSRLDFALASAFDPTRATITGRVTQSGTGDPLANALVRVESGPALGQTTLTDERGFYALLELPPGTYSLSFSRAGHRPAVVAGVVLVAQEVEVVNVALTPLGGGGGGAVLQGTVSDEAGAPLAGVLVEARRGSLLVDSTATDADGAYSLSLAPGAYSVRFSLEGFETVTRAVTLSDGEVETLDVTLQAVGAETGAIAGLVVDPSGRGVPEALVELLRDSTPIESARTDGSGRFEFTGLAPGIYSLRVSGAGFGEETRRVLVSAGTTARITIVVRPLARTGSIAGVVRDRAGRPIAGAVVTIVEAPPGMEGQSQTTGDNGAFNFVGLISGTYTLQVEAEGFRPERLRLRVRAGSSVFRNVYLRRASD